MLHQFKVLVFSMKVHLSFTGSDKVDKFSSLVVTFKIASFLIDFLIKFYKFTLKFIVSKNSMHYNNFLTTLFKNVFIIQLVNFYKLL